MASYTMKVLGILTDYFIGLYVFLLLMTFWMVLLRREANVYAAHLGTVVVTRVDVVEDPIFNRMIVVADTHRGPRRMDGFYEYLELYESYDVSTDVLGNIHFSCRSNRSEWGRRP